MIGRNRTRGTQIDMDKCFRDPALQAQFEAQGYVVVPLLTPEEAAHVRDRAWKFLPSRPAINDPQGALYSSQFDPDCPQGAAEFVSGSVGERFEALLDGHRAIGGCIMAKVAGSGSLGMHQHQPQTPNIYDTIVNCWLTLDDVGADSGALRVVPRSHQVVRHIQSFQSEPYFVDFAEALEDRFAVTLEMRPGEAVLFEGSLLHGSCANARGEASVRLLASSVPAERRFCIITEAEKGIFDAFEAEGVAIDPSLYCISGGNIDALPAAGRMNNRNTRLNEREFAALLDRGAKIRPGHDPIDDVRADAHAARQRAAGLIGKVREFALGALGG